MWHITQNCPNPKGDNKPRPSGDSKNNKDHRQNKPPDNQQKKDRVHLCDDASTSASSLFLVQGSLAGQPATFLIDSGASSSFLASRWSESTHFIPSRQLKTPPSSEGPSPSFDAVGRTIDVRTSGSMRCTLGEWSKLWRFCRDRRDAECEMLEGSGCDRVGRIQ